MRSKVFSALFLLLIIWDEGFAQDWSLFPAEVKLSYKERATGRFGIICNDSVEYIGYVATHLCNVQAPKPEWQTCYNNFYLDDLFGNEKLYFTTVGNEYNIYRDRLSTEPFYFNTDVASGDFWTVAILNDESPWNELTVTFDSLGVASVLEQIDSVRYYSISVSPEAIGTNSIDDYSIILSKNFGLVSYPDFDQLVHGDSCLDCIKVYDLIGYINGVDTLGIVIPKWSDFIQLKPGDLLWYEHGSHSAHFESVSHGYFLREITSVEKYPDSIVVNFLYNGYMPGSDKYFREPVEPIFESYDNTLSYGIFQKSPTTLEHPSIDDLLYAGYTNNYFIDTLRIGEGYSIDYAVEPLMVTPSSCDFTYYYPYSYTLSTYIGCTFSEWSEYSYSMVKLVGSVLSGHVWGETWPITSDDSHHENISIQLQPNPTSYNVYLPFGGTHDEPYWVYDCRGNIVRSGNCAVPVIGVAELQDGIYTVVAIHNDNSYSGKFVKVTASE